VTYREWGDHNGYFRKEWRNELCQLHREDGPAYICYNPDGSIYWEEFYIAGKLLGYDKYGFWKLWERLNEEGRQAPDVLKYLARYS
jgi:hypothetical protein